MDKAFKIFGIGLQRTGTTSLNRALRILGYNSIDAPFGLYPDLDSSIIEKYDAFTDNPIPLLYQRLDKEYPGGKFICTTRDVDSWLKSVKWLFSTGRIEFNWEATPIVDKVHQAFYGIIYFDEKVFREIWFAYHAEVQGYFVERPQDLLMIDLTRGEGWEELCSFLGKEIPKADFPAVNKSTLKRTLRTRGINLIKRVIKRTILTEGRTHVNVRWSACEREEEQVDPLHNNGVNRAPTRKA